MRISDWSSDVCSSDLAALMVAGLASLPLVVLLLMLPEPTHESAEVGQATKESLWASLAILLRRRAFLHLNLGLGISSFGIYGIGQWQTTFLIRSMEDRKSTRLNSSH